MIVIAALALQACQVSMPAQMEIAEAFSSETGDSWISLSPDGTVALAGRHSPPWGNHRIIVMRRTESGWSAPEALLIDGVEWPAQIRSARFRPDGSGIVFSSNFHLSEDRQDMDIWQADFDGQTFHAPDRMPSSVNSLSNEIHPTAVSSGAIYFSSDREGGLGRSDIYRATLNNGSWDVEPVAGLNSEYSEADQYVTPDESLIIFARTGAPDGLGGDDLYAATSGDDGWNPPVHLGTSVNTPEYEYGPWIDEDAGILYVTSHSSDPSDIYQAPIEVRCAAD